MVVEAPGVQHDVRSVQNGVTFCKLQSNLIRLYDYWAPATLGNAADFGDLSVGGTEAAGAFSSTTRGVIVNDTVFFIGMSDTIDYHATTASLGDFSDFGDAACWIT